MPLVIIRFAVFAAICCALLFWWATRVGHGGQGIVAGGILTSWAAAVAWIVAIVLERLAALPLVRLAIHVISAFVVFAAISFCIFMYLDSGHPYYDGDWDFILPLGAIVSFAANRRMYDQWQSAIPSRFVDELPEAHIERISDPGLYGGAGRAPGFGEAAARYETSNLPAAFGPRPRPRIVEAGGYQTAERKRKSAAGFHAGDEVFHQKFGYGKVRSVDGDKLEIAFGTGVKKVLDSFVEPV